MSGEAATKQSEGGDYEMRTTRVIVLERGKEIYSERATSIEIDDEAAGEFVTVRQGEGKICIDVAEWPTIREAIDAMVAACRV
jgi:hypothetical protein